MACVGQGTAAQLPVQAWAGRAAANVQVVLVVPSVACWVGMQATSVAAAVGHVPVPVPFTHVAGSVVDLSECGRVEAACIAPLNPALQLQPLGKFVPVEFGGHWTGMQLPL